MSGVKVFFGLLAVRILSVFIVQSWYVPDEYWQSLEVSHKLVFGYGHLTWEWSKGIRSYIHPVIIAGIYKALEALSLDDVQYLVIVPRIFQAILTAFADYRFYKWTGQSKWSLFMIVSSWFWFYTGSRTLANTVEAALTSIALSYFPWGGKESSSFLWYVALVCFVRPTAAITWLPLCFHHIRSSSLSVLRNIFLRYLPIGLIVGGASVAIDYLAHGSFILTPIEFLKVNVWQEIGIFYGTSPWYWYLVAGLPTVLGLTTLPFLLATIDTLLNRSTFPQRLVLLWSIVFTLAIYSLLPHKEFRFILPILPMCLYITSDYLSRWSRKANDVLIWIVSLALLIANVAPAAYLSIVHQKGTVDVMPHLAKIAKEYKDEDGHRAKLLFLMPCHSTPYFSHIHQNVSMRFLTCEPNFSQQDNYVDEADHFYKDPLAWYRFHIPVYPRTAMPTHLVMFDNLVEKLPEILVDYQQIHAVPHADYPLTERIGNKVLVYERVNPNKQRNDEIIGSGDRPATSTQQARKSQGQQKKKQT
ncbi:GPI mannosyltransferase 3 [Bradysia coprophila]|uniref:GPI mannosyltransferase 3 n=1 Tax=Bradysia coprophila TaxID=38358 RepID=UPI00187D8E97|nr:GPI mannosyltransferase 3 [Bradysia coprophila]XP_037030528.1 GPI mannosyltransferase 3 [Bradysia coprophila]